VQTETHLESETSYIIIQSQSKLYPTFVTYIYNFKSEPSCVDKDFRQNNIGGIFVVLVVKRVLSTGLLRIGEKTVRMPLYPLKIPRGLTWDRNPLFTVWGRPLTVCVKWCIGSWLVTCSTTLGTSRLSVVNGLWGSQWLDSKEGV
jgi:hypothetical protein